MRLGSFAAEAPVLQRNADRGSLDAPGRRGRNVAAPWWAWPSLLALDAPAVAVAWLWAIGDATGHPVSVAALLLVASAVWLAYAADRLLDLRRIGTRTLASDARDVRTRDPRAGPALHRSIRHAFFARHRRRYGRAWAWLFGGSIAAAAVTLSPAAFGLGLLVAILAVTAIAWTDRSTTVGAVARCVSIAIAFAGAIAVGLNAPNDPALLAPLLGFGAVCASNLAWVAAWEARIDDGHATHAAARMLACGVTATAVLGVAAWWWLAPSALALASWVALASLALLGAAGGTIATPKRSAAADLVVVLPLLLVLF